ncbi:MAG: SPOR domain-containing protein [Marinospirillum sp.]|uniref:SPOR domain-containing protein n=1 Tax=Marinospirillum sp. TaxID=2183934 RepID=UPI0019FFE87E|nr:SPOR domain-containing protein [Marinospirillum sp.]MBE0507513.1 SPOR domain-containing protein [Marinospirillum sp.]
MRYGVKERLIGAIALIALAIIFLPFVLEEERPPAPISDKIVTPPAPKPVEVAVEEPQQPEVKSAWTAEEQQQLTRQQQPTAAGVRIDLDGGVEAWAIQVATFGESANARRLVERLQQQGLHPYWRKINGMAVVFAGPYIDQQQGREHQDRLLQDMGLKTLLTRYVPEHEARAQGSLPSRDE